MAEQEFTITVDGNEHKFDDLEPENKGLVTHIRDLESQLEQVNFRFEQLNGAKLFFSDKLIQNLKQPAPEAEAPAAEVEAEAPAAEAEAAASE